MLLLFILCLQKNWIERTKNGLKALVILFGNVDSHEVSVHGNQAREREREREVCSSVISDMRKPLANHVTSLMGE